MRAPGCLAAAAVWAVRAGDHPGDSVELEQAESFRAHDRIRSRFAAQPALLHTGMGLDRVQRDVQPRANLTPGETSRDASQHREAGRAWLPRRAEVLVLARADRPNSLLVEPKLMIARGP